MAARGPARTALVIALVVLIPGSARVATAAHGTPVADVERLAGQAIMTGFAGLDPDAALLSRIRRGQVGGVILFGRNIGTQAALTSLVHRLQAAAAAGGNPPLLVAVDQEGGPVKRLPAGPPRVSPSTLGRLGSGARARLAGRATGAYLRRLGIDVDLAPVLDSPDARSSFLAGRAFGLDPRVNADVGAGFIAGLQDERVAATAKHFPGLGTARADTDTNHVLIATPRAELEERLLPFRAAIAAGVELVMVSNAGYVAYDPSGVPALLSPAIVDGLLRRQLGFHGVAISDAMEAPGPSSSRGSAVRAISAGVDVLLYSSETDAAAGYKEIVAAARSGRLPLTRLRPAGARIARLKHWLSAR